MLALDDTQCLECVDDLWDRGVCVQNELITFESDPIPEEVEVYACIVVKRRNLFIAIMKRVFP